MQQNNKCSAKVSTQGLAFARQALDHLSHSASPLILILPIESLTMAISYNLTWQFKTILPSIMQMLP
jgi:hypothetical protein